VSLASILANRFLIDVKEMKRIRNEISLWRKEYDRARKTNDKKMMEKVMKKQQAIMKLQSKMMWSQMKVSFIFLIPLWAIWIILGGVYTGSNAVVALSPFSIPYLLAGPVDPTFGAYGVYFASWYIICAFAVSFPLSRIFGIYGEGS
jgi:uncharacterized membrane protein (DUF106 family)